MGSQNQPEPGPVTPIGLRWRPRFNTLNRSLDARMAAPDRKDAEVVAHTILLLIAGGGNPTPNQIVDHIYEVWRPGAGWMGFDRNAWLALVPRVVEVLRSERPGNVHRM